MANGIDIGARLPFITTVLASKFGSINLKPITVALSGIQAWVLWRGTQDTKKFQSAYKMQSYFNLANLAVNFWSFGHLVNELGKKYPFFNVHLTWNDLGHIFSAKSWKYTHPVWTSGAQLRFSAYGYGAMIGGIIAASYAVGLMNKIHSSSQQHLKIEELGSADPEKQKVLAKEVTIAWNRPLGQKFAQWIYISQIGLNIALAALSSSRLSFALNLAFAGYALYEITKRKWLNVTRTRAWELGLKNHHVHSIKAVYRCFLMRASAQQSKKNEKCTFCLDEKPDVYFHGEHLFHEKCLIQMVVLKSEDFVTLTSMRRKETTDREGRLTVTYRGKMPLSTKPGCPNCREKPLYNELDIIVNEARYTTTADIQWEEEK